MPALDWRLAPDPGGEAETDRIEWDEVWTVAHFVPTPGEPAWLSLLLDRPDLAPGTIRDRPIARVARFKAEPVGTSYAWEVTVTYRSGAPDEKDKPPLDRSAQIDTDFASVEVPTHTFYDGTPILSTAGGLLTGCTRTENRVSFNFEKNLAAYPGWLTAYGDATNSDTVVVGGISIAPGFLMLTKPKIGRLEREQVGETEYLYYPTTFSIVYSPRGWKAKYLNRDLFEIAFGQRVRITEKNDQGEWVEVDEPQLLDADGKRLPQPIDPSKVTFIEGYHGPQLPFNDLPLT